MKSKLTQFFNYLESITKCESLSVLQLTELQCRINKLEQTYDLFDNLQMEIEEIAEDATIAYFERDVFENQYYAQVARAQTILAAYKNPPSTSANAGVSGLQLKEEQVSNKNISSLVRLPAIDIPRFDGQHKSWLEFRDSFISLIDKNEGIDDISKLRYLQSALQGSPALLVLENLEICAENYKQAWQTLCSRYEKPRLLVNKHLESLFSLDSINKETCTGIRRLIDITNTNLRALKTLKQPVDQWDRIIVFLLESKLDPSTSKEWEHYRSSNLSDFPSLAELLKFLENKSDYLASLEESKQTKIEPYKQKSFTFNTNSSQNNSNTSSLYTQGNKSQSTKQNTNIYTNQNTNNFKPKEKQCPMCKQDHNLFMCEVFRNASIEVRNAKVREAKLCLNCLRPGHPTQKCRCFTNCKYCRQRHNTLLHTDEASGEKLVALSANIIQNPISSQVLLSTALVKVIDCQGGAHTARILLDNGSTANFITSALCDKLGVLKRNETSTVTGVNNQTCTTSQCCQIQIQSFTGIFKCDLTCFILQKITTMLPSTYININNINLPTDITLADPTFHLPSVIDILVGAEVFWNILGNNSIDLGKHQPKLFETKLGWLISGQVQQFKQPLVCNFLQNNYDTQTSDLARFWEIDSISDEHLLTSEQKACESNFKLTTHRDKNGQFVVTMPLKSSPNILGDSLNRAKVRFFSLERKFRKEPEFKRRYLEFMREYIELGHMTENTNIPPKSSQVSYFLPHHGVIREQSSTTKLRVVFDASSASSTGISLNDLQMVGPTVQEDLFSILIRFRQNKYVVTGDVCKMYRCIILDESQRSLQQIVFRFDEDEPLKTYTLNTLTYGTASAPYIATKCLTSLGDSEDVDPDVRNAITRDFYVDDYLGGSNSVQDAIKLCKGVSSVLASANFILRKWHSNNNDILKAITSNTEPSKSLNLDSSASSKTLGIYWLCNLDLLSFQIDINFSNKVTKRHILSIISQIFDPLGLIGPCIIQAKVIMQKLWLDKSSWDEVVSQDILQLWQSFANTLPLLNSLKIPRWVLCENVRRIEIHTFTDASEIAYGACVYVRAENGLGQFHTNLLTSKNKIAPIKTQTMPRLELCAALLGARLCSKVVKSLTIHIDSQHFWCDSTIALGWISSTQGQLPPFVRNRVGEIQELTQGYEWCYVPSLDNPADLVSRGVTTDKISEASIWWHGPPFLNFAPEMWPKHPSLNTQIQKDTQITTIHEYKTLHNLHNKNQTNIYTISDLIHKCSSHTKLQRAVAYILRFIYNCRHTFKNIGALSTAELKAASTLIISIAQKEMFPEEYELIKSCQTLPSKNRLASLTPFLDNRDIIRVGGRLDNSPYSYEIKHPILMHGKHHLTGIIFRMHHLNLLHAGPQLLLANIQQHYWVLGGRNLSKKIVKQCVKCCRFKAETVQPIMGQLPVTRTNLEFPFLHTGVDYAGPLLIADRKGRGCKLVKAYICIFVCLAVKAVHLELVSDLTKEAYIAALNRFVARRGKPQIIMSDNGTTFIGASNEIAKIVSDFNLDNDLAQIGIKFKFVPPYTPHFNGISEAAVRSTKSHLKKILSLTHLTFEEMATCLAHIESILNSRPLTPLSSDPSDLTALTPSHFLIGRPLLSVPHQEIHDVNINRLDRFRRIEMLRSHFWRRYSTEYVPLLQQKTKWKSSSSQLRENTLVLIKDKSAPPLLWLLGRITKIYPGPDNQNRVADIKTNKGTLRRAFNNICPLPEQ